MKTKDPYRVSKYQVSMLSYVTAIVIIFHLYSILAVKSLCYKNINLKYTIDEYDPFLWLLAAEYKYRIHFPHHVHILLYWRWLFSLENRKIKRNMTKTVAYCYNFLSSVFFRVTDPKKHWFLSIQPRFFCITPIIFLNMT